MDNVPVVAVLDSRQDLPELVASRTLIHATKPGDIICKEDIEPCYYYTVLTSQWSTWVIDKGSTTGALLIISGIRSTVNPPCLPIP